MQIHKREAGELCVDQFLSLFDRLEVVDDSSVFDHIPALRRVLCLKDRATDVALDVYTDNGIGPVDALYFRMIRNYTDDKWWSPFAWGMCDGVLAKGEARIADVTYYLLQWAYIGGMYRFERTGDLWIRTTFDPLIRRLPESSRREFARWAENAKAISHGVVSITSIVPNQVFSRTYIGDAHEKPVLPEWGASIIPEDCLEQYAEHVIFPPAGY